MKILASADLHGYYDAYRWIVDIAEKTGVAAVVLAGDLLGCPDDNLPIEEAQTADGKQVLSILERLTVPLFYIMGNDDMIDLPAAKDWIQCLQGKRVDLGGYNFVGYQYTLPFMGGIFEKPEEEIAHDLLQMEQLLDEQTVFVTHGTAKGILDMGTLGLHAGSESLWRLMERRPIRAHIHGHIHEAFGCSDNHFNVASAGEKRCMIIDLSNMKHEIIQENELEKPKHKEM